MLALYFFRFHPYIPVCVRFLSNLLPHLLETLIIMAPSIRHRRQLPLLSHHITRLAAEDRTPRKRLQKLDHLLTSFHLFVPVEKMEEQASVNKIHLSLHVRQWSIVSKDIRGQHRCLQPSMISEELVAQVEELPVEIATDKVLRRRTVERNFADILTETAAEVKERRRMTWILECGKHTRIRRMLGKR